VGQNTLLRQKFKMYVKVHKDGLVQVLAVCDEDIIGKTIEDEKIKIEVSERFYKGQAIDEKKCLKMMKEFGNINMIGKKCVKLALDNGIIEKDNIILINKIPHAQLISL